MKYKVAEVARYRVLWVLQVSTQKRDKLPKTTGLQRPPRCRICTVTEIPAGFQKNKKRDNYWSYRGVAEISAVKKDRKNRKQKTQSCEVTGLWILEIPEKQKSRGYENPRVTEEQEKPSLESYMFYLFVLFFAFFFQLSFSKKNKTSPEPLLLGIKALP